MKAKDGRAVARQNELNILRALHRFGWLRTRDVAMLVWSRWKKRPTTSLSLQALSPSVASGGKKPDVLLRSESGAVWVEVERSRKNQRDYAKLLQWLQSAHQDKLRHGRPQLSGNVTLEKIVFVCTNTFQKRLVRDLKRVNWSTEDVETLLAFECSLYAVQDIRFD